MASRQRVLSCTCYFTLFRDCSIFIYVGIGDVSLETQREKVQDVRAQHAENSTTPDLEPRAKAEENTRASFSPSIMHSSRIWCGCSLFRHVTCFEPRVCYSWTRLNGYYIWISRPCLRSRIVRWLLQLERNFRGGWSVKWKGIIFFFNDIFMKSITDKRWVNERIEY